MSSSIGDISEAYVMAKLLEFGFMPSIPFGPKPYDFLLDTGEKLLKIQVKTAKIKENGSIRISTGKGRSSKSCYVGLIDAILAYEPRRKLFLAVTQVPEHVTTTIKPQDLNNYLLEKDTFK